jgi:hypothetical protein
MHGLLTLQRHLYRLDKDIYITGMFNNYALSERVKMEYNEKKGRMKKVID